MDCPSASGSTIEELAEYWAANAKQIRKYDAWSSAVRRRLSQVVKDGGPILTGSGRISVESSGYDYPDEIAMEFPGLGSHVLTVTVDTLEKAERILDLVTEEVPSADVAHSLKVDGRSAASLINQGGEAAKRLLDLRQPKKGKLALK